MKRHFAIVLLFAVLAMNMDMICQSLCLAGHGDMNHASPTMTGHTMPPEDVCPITHTAHHAMPQSSIKCDCSADQVAAIGFEFTSPDAALNVAPHLRMVSTIQPQDIIFLSKEPAPLEGPPKILVSLESSVLKA